MKPDEIDFDEFFDTKTDYISSYDGKRYEKIIDPYGNMEIREIPTYYSNSSGISLSTYIENNDKPYKLSYGSSDDYKKWKKIIRESERKSKVNITSERLNSKTHRVYCDDMTDLAIENILKTLASMRGRLMLDIAPLSIESIECNVTPEIKNRLLVAGKRLKMYGKKPPLTVRFDEWGNRLPDEIKTEDGSGILLKIVEPKFYGELYFELKATKKIIPDYHDYDGSIPF